MINKCRWGIVMVAAITASGRRELVGAFVRKADAEEYLRQREPSAKARRSSYEIVKLPT